MMFVHAKIFAFSSMFSMAIFTITSCALGTSTINPTPSIVPTKNASPVGLGNTEVSPKDHATMMYIPSGQFPMGSEFGLIDEQPVHIVMLDDYWLDRTEVTNEMYQKCVKAESCEEPSNLIYYNDPEYSNHPVVFVSWTNAVAYCSFVDRRLPTEAEWEKAATWNPTKEEKRVYPWGNEYNCSKGNFDDETQLDSSLMRDGSVACDGFTLTAPVGNFPEGASPYGALDMGGNVWEWVHDAFIGVDSFNASGLNYYAVSRFENPKGANPSITDYRSMRGGSWNWIYGYGRSAYRLGFGKNNTFEGVGFRCAESSGLRGSGGARKGR
jgi:formylglycine-generating enzyme required for sulfatase activity